MRLIGSQDSDECGPLEFGEVAARQEYAVKPPKVLPRIWNKRSQVTPKLHGAEHHVRGAAIIGRSNGDRAAFRSL